MCQNYDTFNDVIKQATHASDKTFCAQHKQHQTVAQFEEAFHFIVDVYFNFFVTEIGQLHVRFVEFSRSSVEECVRLCG